MGGLQKQREEKQAKFVGKVIQEQGVRKQAFYDGVPNPNVNSWGMVKTSTPTLQNAKRGRDIMHAIRKQGSSAAQERRFQPTRQLVPSAKTQIKKAPEWMVREQKKPGVAPAAVAPARVGEGMGRSAPQVFAPKRGPSATERALDDAVRAKNAEREARLRALTDPKKKAAGDLHSPARVQPTQSAASHTPPSVPKSRVDALTAVDRRLSPNPAQAVRKRPAPALFMPAKKKKV